VIVKGTVATPGSDTAVEHSGCIQTPPASREHSHRGHNRSDPACPGPPHPRTDRWLIGGPAAGSSHSIILAHSGRLIFGTMADDDQAERHTAQKYSNAVG